MSEYKDFFFSYASKDRFKAENDDLDRFGNDLTTGLRAYGLHRGGFFAPDDMERGGEWERTLPQLLSRSRVLVAMYSPNYFDSYYCGKEWQVFRERQEENTTNPPLGVTAANVILPIIWTANFLRLPDGVPALQFRKDADPEVYQQRGLRYIMQSRGHRKVYDALIDRFAQELAAMVMTQGDDRDRSIKPWAEVDPPFPRRYKRGVGFVRYVFLAGRKADMISRRKAQSYGGFADRRDWRPFDPDVTRQAGEVAERVANEARKDFEFVESGSVAERVVLARELNNLVAIVADPWSIRLPEFNSLVQILNGGDASFPNAGVLVTWNEQDDETRKRKPELRNAVGDAFAGVVARQEHYNPEITSAEMLSDALRAIFNAVPGKLVESGQLPSAQPGLTQRQPFLNVT